MTAANPAESAGSNVGVEYVGKVAVLTLRSPHRRNALNGELAGQILEHLADLRDNEDVAALVVAAEGPDFCAGGDLDMLARVGGNPLNESAYQELGQIYRVFSTLLDFPIPTIAAVQGNVVGAGVNLALATDLVVVSDDVAISGFGPAGMHPGGGHLSMLARKAQAAGAALALFGQCLGAEEAVRTGFAWCAVARSSLLDCALDCAQQAAIDPPLTRMVTATYRASAANHLTPDAAVLVERAPQVWSLRRASLSRERLHS